MFTYNEWRKVFTMNNITSVISGNEKQLQKINSQQK